MRIWTKDAINDLTYQIIGCAIEVHSTLGPGLLESVYERCMIRELALKDLRVRSQVRVPVNYKGVQLDADLRLDLIVEESIVIEIKAVEALNPVYAAQILSYMKLLQLPKGILFNFCSPNIFKEGQRTFVNDIFSALPPN
jgi:GxxExxY protein